MQVRRSPGEKPRPGASGAGHASNKTKGRLRRDRWSRLRRPQPPVASKGPARDSPHILCWICAVTRSADCESRPRLRWQRSPMIQCRLASTCRQQIACRLQCTCTPHLRAAVLGKRPLADVCILRRLAVPRASHIASRVQY
jgi:hypothetical protein